MQNRFTALLLLLGGVLFTTYLLNNCAARRTSQGVAYVSGVQISLWPDHVYRCVRDADGIWHLEDITDQFLPPEQRRRPPTPTQR